TRPSVRFAAGESARIRDRIRRCGIGRQPTHPSHRLRRLTPPLGERMNMTDEPTERLTDVSDLQYYVRVSDSQMHYLGLYAQIDLGEGDEVVYLWKPAGEWERTTMTIADVEEGEGSLVFPTTIAKVTADYPYLTA